VVTGRGNKEDTIQDIKVNLYLGSWNIKSSPPVNKRLFFSPWSVDFLELLNVIINQ
jgi:hypothetical protein